MYVIVYAKMTISKSIVKLDGVYFGGICDDEEESSQIARDCVNNIRGGAIMPKVIEISDDYNVLDAMLDATDKFEYIARQMIEANNIIEGNNKRKKVPS